MDQLDQDNMAQDQLNQEDMDQLNQEDMDQLNQEDMDQSNQEDMLSQEDMDHIDQLNQSQDPEPALEHPITPVALPYLHDVFKLGSTDWHFVQILINVLGHFMDAVRFSTTLPAHNRIQYRQQQVRLFLDDVFKFYKIIVPETGEPDRIFRFDKKISRQQKVALKKFPALRFYDVRSNLYKISADPGTSFHDHIVYPDGRVSRYSTQWLIFSCLHPKNRMNRAVAKSLGDHLIPYYIPSGAWSNFEFPNGNTEQDFWPGLNDVLCEGVTRCKDTADPFAEEDLLSVLRLYIRLKCWVADNYLASYDLLEEWEEDEAYLLGEPCVLRENGVLWRALGDPSLENTSPRRVTFLAKQLVSRMNMTGNVEFLFHVLYAWVAHDGVSPDQLVFRVYQWIIRAATNAKMDQLDHHTVLNIVKRNFEFWDVNMEPMPPNWRPLDCPNELASMLEEDDDDIVAEDTFEIDEFDPPEDVPVEPIGPRKDPLTFSTPFDGSSDPNNICRHSAYNQTAVNIYFISTALIA
jgi:hypothetical protein